MFQKLESEVKKVVGIGSVPFFHKDSVTDIDEDKKEDCMEIMDTVKNK